MAKIIVEFTKASSGRVTVRIDGEVNRGKEDPAVVSLALAIKKMIEVKLRAWTEGPRSVQDPAKNPTTPPA